jgi:hypothetical protein
MVTLLIGQRVQMQSQSAALTMAPPWRDVTAAQESVPGKALTQMHNPRSRNATDEKMIQATRKNKKRVIRTREKAQWPNQEGQCLAQSLCRHPHSAW